MKTIYLPDDHVEFGKLAHLIASALHPLGDDSSDREMMAWGAARGNLEAELLKAVKTGALQVKDPIAKGPHTYPVGDALNRALVSVDDLREFLDGRGIVVEVAESQPAPVKGTATPAPVAIVSDGPTPLTTGDIAYCFAGLRWDESAWKKPLGDKPKWLLRCVAIPGQQGVSETRWNPVLIGAELVQQGHVKARSVRAKFQTVDLLSPWLDDWKTYEADNLDNE